MEENITTKTQDGYELITEYVTYEDIQHVKSQIVPKTQNIGIYRDFGTIETNKKNNCKKRRRCCCQ